MFTSVDTHWWWCLPLPPAPGQSYQSLEGRLKLVIQPQSQQLHAGETLQLECGAVGRPIPRYQWHRNGVPILNATKRKLTVRICFHIVHIAKKLFLVWKRFYCFVTRRHSPAVPCAFQIPHVMQDHNGRYRCEISSGSSERMWTNEVDVVTGMSNCSAVAPAPSKQLCSSCLSDCLLCSRLKAPRISVQFSGAMECSEGRVERPG